MIGFAIKSGTLGQVYMKTQRDTQAKQCFDQAKSLVEDEDVQQQEEEIAQVGNIEFAIARQHCLCNLGDWAASTGDRHTARTHFINALEMYPIIDKNVQRRALMGLRDLYNDCNQKVVGDEIHKILTTIFGAQGGTTAGPRDIALILDYSGSMSGGKHRISMRNMRMVFNDYVNDDDSVMFIYFSSRVNVAWDLMPKKGNEPMMNGQFDKLVMPGGGTAYYDAIGEAVKQLGERGNKQQQQWIIALTDGDDNRSMRSLKQIKEEVSKSAVNGLIVVAVGGDVSSAPALAELAACSPQGTMVLADAGQDSIDAAFQQVTKLITGQVMLEDY